MPVQLVLENDEALVLYELLASEQLSDSVEAPERAALDALHALLERELVEPFSAEYARLLQQARDSLVLRYG